MLVNACEDHSSPPIYGGHFKKVRIHWGSVWKSSTLPQSAPLSQVKIMPLPLPALHGPQATQVKHKSVLWNKTEFPIIIDQYM